MNSIVLEHLKNKSVDNFISRLNSIKLSMKTNSVLKKFNNYEEIELYLLHGLLFKNKYTTETHGIHKKYARLLGPIFSHSSSNNCLECKDILLLCTINGVTMREFIKRESRGKSIEIINKDLAL